MLKHAHKLIFCHVVLSDYLFAANRFWWVFSGKPPKNDRRRTMSI